MKECARSSTLDNWSYFYTYAVTHSHILNCACRFISSIFERLPISFKMKVYPHDVHATYPILTSQPKKQTASFFHFSCFSDSSCLESSEEPVDHHPTAKYATASTYTTLGTEEHESDIVYLQTRKPQWNREINHWVHNFGGRVKIPSNKNFLVTQVSATEHSSALGYSRGGASAGLVPASAAVESVAERVVIRHGKVITLNGLVDAVIASSSLCWASLIINHFCDLPYSNFHLTSLQCCQHIHHISLSLT